MMKAWNKKRIILLSFVLLFAALLLVQGTLAYLRTETPKVDNLFAPAVVNIAVAEGEEQYETGGGKTYSFGAGAIEKPVKIVNLDKEGLPSTDAFVRVQLVAVLRDAEGNNLGAVDVSYHMADSAKWILSQDGYYYYIEAVAPGMETEQLLEQVVVGNPEAIPKNSTIEIHVLADAVQARPTPDTVAGAEHTPVWQAWGVYPPNLVNQ